MAFLSQILRYITRIINDCSHCVIRSSSLTHYMAFKFKFAPVYPLPNSLSFLVTILLLTQTYSSYVFP